MKEARRTPCGVEGLQRCTGTRTKRAPGRHSQGGTCAAKASSKLLEASFWVAGNCRRTSYTLRDRRRFPCSRVVKLPMLWTTSARPPVARGCYSSFAAGAHLSERRGRTKCAFGASVLWGQDERKRASRVREARLHRVWDGTQL